VKLRIALLYHSLVSDWNHGNAHFLRGVASELQARGHEVSIYEPEDGWSRENLLRDYGPGAMDSYARVFPHLRSQTYRLSQFDVDHALNGIDLALVHEWNHPDLIAAIGNYRRSHSQLRLFFHDTHHRALTAQEELARFDLTNYDGVLAYGASLKDAYERLGWGKQVYVWHEAADTRVFYPRHSAAKDGDVVWIGNWGDEERTEELREYLLHPVKVLKLQAAVHGVRYPEFAQAELAEAGICYKGWLPNFLVPDVFARFRATVHVPRRPYVEKLAGIPTIRPFEALACGIPLVSAPWLDTEGLFRVGQDFLMAHNEEEMQSHLYNVLNNPDLARSLCESGLETIRNRHTCGHRAEELMRIYEEVKH
jgi:spore maturation protein CgeB